MEVALVMKTYLHGGWLHCTSWIRRGRVCTCHFQRHSALLCSSWIPRGCWGVLWFKLLVGAGGRRQAAGGQGQGERTLVGQKEELVTNKVKETHLSPEKVANVLRRVKARAGQGLTYCSPLLLHSPRLVP